MAEDNYYSGGNGGNDGNWGSGLWGAEKWGLINYGLTKGVNAATYGMFHENPIGAVLDAGEMAIQRKPVDEIVAKTSAHWGVSLLPQELLPHSEVWADR